jgi:predicted deacylase
MKKNKIVAIALLTIALGLTAVASSEFLQMKKPDVVYPASGLTKKSSLSAYCSSLKGTSGDTPIYFFDSKQPGATVLVLGGTHPNEPAGFISAVVLVENLKVQGGKFIVIPQACGSGFTCTDPLEGYPESFSLQAQHGLRNFRFGSRVSNPLDQWPDPLVYRHFPSGQSLSGFETRNLNRSYPGRVNGNFCERVGYAILNLIKTENVDVAFDLHEAAPEIPIINAIIGHEKCQDISAAAILELEMNSLTYALEVSPKNFRGLSHREWGDSSKVLPFLMETSNPIQGRLRGKTDANLLTQGVDRFYAKAKATANFRITYDEVNGYPLKVRVARHLAGISAILGAYNDKYPEKQIKFSNIPSYEEVTSNDVGHYLH